MRLYGQKFLAVAVFCLSFFQAGSAFAHHPFFIKNSGRAAPVAPATKVLYYGGPVLSNAKIHTVFWGNSVDPAIQSAIVPFYKALVNSTYLDQLAEYGTSVIAVDGRDGTHQTIGRGTYGETVTIAPQNAATTLTQADIEKELDFQIDQGALPQPDANSLYMIHYPPGIAISISFGGSCSTWYADHEVYQSPKHGPIVYALMACGNNQASFSSLTTAASHEIAEAITDPFSPLANQPVAYPAAWLDAGLNEIADICAWMPATLTAGSTTYSVQQEWSNAQNVCVNTSYH